MLSSFWKNMVRFAFLVLLQVLVLEQIHLPGNLPLILYPIALMMLPFQTGYTALILTGFGCGLIVDICCGTPGLNAFAATLMVFSRILYFKITDLHDLRESELAESPLPSLLGWSGFVRYTAVMSLMFSLAYFFLEAGGLNNFFYTLYLSTGCALILFLVHILFVNLFVRKTDK